jgi:hypothetical protein
MDTSTAQSPFQCLARSVDDHRFFSLLISLSFSRPFIVFPLRRYRGVTQHRRTGRWEAHVWDGGKQTYLGGFDSEANAGRAYGAKLLAASAAALFVLPFGCCLLKAASLLRPLLLFD